MSPETRAELDLVNQAIGSILDTLKSHQEDLDAKARDLQAKEQNLQAKERNLAAKAEHLNTLTAFAGAARVMLRAVQQVMSEDPAQRAALSAAIAQVSENYQDRLLFSTVPDESIAAIKEEVDRLLSPALRPNPPNVPPAEQ